MSERRRRPYTKPRMRELDPEEGRRLMAAAGEDPSTNEDKGAGEAAEPRNEEQP